MRRLVSLCLAGCLLAPRLTSGGPSEIAVRMRCPALSEVRRLEKVYHANAERLLGLPPTPVTGALNAAPAAPVTPGGSGAE